MTLAANLAKGCPICARIAAMAKKKNQPKKHRFKSTEITEASTEGQPIVSASASAPAAHKSAPAALAGSAAILHHEYSYVGPDLRRVLLLAGALVVLELVLWYLFENTGLGSAIYNLVNV